ncbi:MAG: N-acetylneuraminate synthase family protein [Spirochaetales bacterium]|jgi:N-acetylneuraminate synthase|nr:N-acetylneuraminate synthase family protein [Spirochaetales bacterium]
MTKTPIEKTLIAAEIGTAHGGDIVKAGELIAAAAEAGADAAKFQLVYADEILHPLSGNVELPGGSIPLYERFRALEKPAAFYEELKNLTEEAGLLFISSPFGIKSARILRDIGASVLKIASPELNHFPLLEEAASLGLSVILSTGVSSLADIEKAVLIFRASPSFRAKLTLLHCVTAYPAPEEDYNINLIPNLSAIFGLPAGVSDHSQDPILVPVLAALRGAVLIEKHFTLNPGGSGLDDPIALPPEKFRLMAREVRSAQTEAQAGREAEVLEALEAAYGEHRLRRVLGNGVKTLAPCEAANYATTRRSLHALREIQPGEIITRENTALLRSEKNLRPGLPPEFAPLAYAHPAVRTIPPGEGILWEDILGR